MSCERLASIRIGGLKKADLLLGPWVDPHKQAEPADLETPVRAEA